MHISRDGRFIRTDIWREGDYLDLWSVPHFLSGLLVGFSLYLVGFEFASSCVISLLSLIAYEMFEVIIEVRETWMNRILDVLVGMLSFSTAFLVSPLLSDVMFFTTSVSVGLIDLALSTFGWTASHKASVLEGKLRGEFKEQRQKMRERRVRFNEQVRTQRNRWRTRRRWWKLHHKKREHEETNTTPHVHSS